jgi:uncharacterized cupredoxin-like copper-binding protein
MNKPCITAPGATALALALALTHGAAGAHGPAGHGARHAEGSYPVVQTDFGIAGLRKRVRRTVIIDMDDTMRFTPSRVDVEEGDTIRFVLRNKGQVRHEWVLGTGADLKIHAEMMRRQPDMAHDALHMVHLDPGQNDELVWTFNRAGRFAFACLISGHHEAGMVGTLVVVPKAAPKSPPRKESITP